MITYTIALTTVYYITGSRLSPVISDQTGEGNGCTIEGGSTASGPGHEICLDFNGAQ